MRIKIYSIILLVVISCTINWEFPANFIGDFSPKQINDYPNNLSIFVTPPITDEEILPDGAVLNNFVSSLISLKGTPGELKPATFTINTPVNLSGLTLDASDLTDGLESIPLSAVDIRVVKCWYQDEGNGGIGSSGKKVLVPELLLKDSQLIKVENGENYLKMIDGKYRWISDPTSHDWYFTPTPAEFPVKDSDTLQPVDIRAGENQQFWVLISIPQTAKAGTYRGTLSLRDASQIIAQIQLQLEVLPFSLSQSMLEHDLYYFGVIDSNYPNGSISHAYKSDQQMQAEFKDMAEHGITNVVLGNSWDTFNPLSWDYLGKILSMKNLVGMKKSLYYGWMSPQNRSLKLNWQTSDPIKLEAIKQVIEETINFTRQYGVTDVYFYGLDEIYDSATISKLKPSFDAIHDAGAKVFIAGLDTLGNYSNLLGKSVDIINNTGKPEAQIAAKAHSVGLRIFCYGYPQVGLEKPETYRRNYGLLLWQNDYDGSMNFAYQGGNANIWNDFDSVEYKEHVFAYPTMNGVIDTLQWEGWREGVTDVRYLTTLLNLIKKNNELGVDTASIEAWVAKLKATDLSSLNLDVVREQIISGILSLIVPPNVVTGAASNVTANGATLNGKLLDSGTANNISFVFEWGSTTNYGNIAAISLVDMNTNGTFSARVSGLIPSTTYHYRAKAVGDGTVYGSDQTFTTHSNSWWSWLLAWLKQWFK